MVYDIKAIAITYLYKLLNYSIILYINLHYFYYFKLIN